MTRPGYDLVLLDEHHHPIGTIARTAGGRRAARRAKRRKVQFLDVPAHRIKVRRHKAGLPCDLIVRDLGVLHVPSFAEIARIKRLEDR